MSLGLKFLHNGESYPISLILMKKLPIYIIEELESKTEYEIKSKVQHKNIQPFINHLQDENPKLDIDSSNAYDFYELSKEFDDNELTRRIEKEFHDILQAAKINDISESERFNPKNNFSLIESLTKKVTELESTIDKIKDSQIQNEANLRQIYDEEMRKMMQQFHMQNCKYEEMIHCLNQKIEIQKH